MKIYLAFITSFLFSGICFSQITEPAPYCGAGYLDVFGGLNHHISSVELNTLNNVSGAVATPAPHYIYYNDLPATDLERGSTQDLIINHSGGVTIHMIAAWIDFNNDGDFTDVGEKIGEEHWPPATELTFTFTVPATAAIGVTRMRVRVYEDDDYTFSELDPPALPCEHSALGVDTDFGEGETEDYDVNITDPDDEVELTALFTPEGATICSDEEITYTDESISEDGVTAWNWTFDGGLPAVAATEGPHNVLYDTPGVYDVTLEVTDATGVHDTTFTITVLEDCDEIEAVFTPTDLDICVGDCLNFEDASVGIGIVEYAWTFSDPAIGGPIIGEETGLVCFDNPGEQLVTLTITNGVVVDDTTITINVRELPAVTITADPGTEVCEGDEVTLSGGGALTYLWSGGIEDGVVFNPLFTETYVVIGEDDFGCFGEAEITINVVICEPVIADFESLEEICVGDCITFVDQSIGEPVTWAWDFGGLDISEDQNPIFCFETAGEVNVSLTVTNAAGDEAMYNNLITVFDAPTVNAAHDTIVDLGGSASLIANGSDVNGTYIWSPDDNVVCEDCPITTVNPSENQTYIVVHTSANGCSSSDSVVVLVNFIEGVGVATAFSPNYDGNNDVLFVQGYGIKQMYFAVYNRYGELMFETTEQNIGWDGTFMGKEQNSGVFHWLLQYELVDGKSGMQKGNTTLIK